MADDIATPPSFGEIGSKADDLFDSGFNYGFYGLSCSTRTRNECEFSGEIKREVETNEVSGNLSSTLINSKEHGFVLRDSWSTDNTLTTEATLSDPFGLEGFTFGVENEFKPNTKEHASTIKSSFASESLNVDTSYDVKGKVLNVATVVGAEGYMAGVQVDYDVGAKKVGDYTIALGVDNDDITTHVAVTNFTDISARMYRKVNRQVETGAFMNYSKDSGNEFGMAARYCPHEDTTFTGKVNSSAEVGLSFQQAVHPGVTMTLSALIQSKNFHAGGHKVGLGLELNP